MDKQVPLFDRMILSILVFFFRCIHREVSEEWLAGIVQFVKFGIVGVSNTVVSYVIYLVTIWLMAPYHVSWDFYFGNIVAFVLSVLWSFYWNNRYVFTLKEGEERNLGKTLLKTYASYAFSGLVLSNVLSFVWVNLFGISKVIAPLFNLLISVPINFFMNKLWAFRSEKQTEV